MLESKFHLCTLENNGDPKTTQGVGWIFYSLFENTS
jgi:hypothetical protein